MNPSIQIYDPTPECAHLNAELMVEAAKRLANLDLDYSEASIQGVDDLIEQFRGWGWTDKTVGSALFCLGCYLGEVFVRIHGASWVNADETIMKDAAGWPIIIQLGSDRFCNPIGKVFKRMQNGPEDSLIWFYEFFCPQSNST